MESIFRLICVHLEPVIIGSVTISHMAIAPMTWKFRTPNICKSVWNTGHQVSTPWTTRKFECQIFCIHNCRDKEYRYVAKAICNIIHSLLVSTRKSWIYLLKPGKKWWEQLEGNPNKFTKLINIDTYLHVYVDRDDHTDPERLRIHSFQE